VRGAGSASSTYPEPVIVADRNFNRGVDPPSSPMPPTRFAMLDKNGDGKIEHDELPKIVAGPPWPGRRQGRGGYGAAAAIAVVAAWPRRRHGRRMGQGPWPG
jgi:hypothetical protein